MTYTEYFTFLLQYKTNNYIVIPDFDIEPFKLNDRYGDDLNQDNIEDVTVVRIITKDLHYSIDITIDMKLDVEKRNNYNDHYCKLLEYSIVLERKNKIEDFLL